MKTSKSSYDQWGVCDAERILTEGRTRCEMFCEMGTILFFLGLIIMFSALWIGLLIQLIGVALMWLGIFEDAWARVVVQQRWSGGKKISYNIFLVSALKVQWREFKSAIASLGRDIRLK